MSRGRVRQRTKTSTLLNSITIIIIIITTIIITIANIADIMMSPASSWYLPDTAVIIIIITTITIITASTAATIEVARYRMMKNRTLRVLFFCGLELISSD
jgi:hypothetical protein